MNDLAKLAKEVKDKRAEAHKDLSEADPKNMPGLMMAKKRAMEELKGLEAHFCKTARANLAVTFLTGEKDAVNKFAEICRSEGNAIVLHAQEIYEKMADPVFKTLGPNTKFGSASLARLNSAISQIGEDVGYSRIPFPTIREVTVTPDIESTTAKVKELVQTVCSNWLNLAYLNKQIDTALLTLCYINNVIPVVVKFGQANEEQALGEKLGRLVKFPTSITEENATEATSHLLFKSMQKTLKPIKQG